jgi:hypothetical protein
VSMHLEVRNARDMWAVVKAFTAAHQGYLTVSQASSAQCIATAAMTVSTSSMDRSLIYSVVYYMYPQ